MRAFNLIVSCLLCLLTFSLNVSAQQITRKSRDSISNTTTKYLTWTYTPSKTVGVWVTFVKGTGTPAATVTLEGRGDTIKAVWTPITDIDTFILTNLDSVTYGWRITGQYFNGLRIKIVPTGTQKTYVYSMYMRRPDD